MLGCSMFSLPRALLVAALTGTIYGLVVYAWLNYLNDDVGVMVVSYLFLVPFVLGLFVPFLHGQAQGGAPSPEHNIPSEPPRRRQKPLLVRMLGHSLQVITVFLLTALIFGFEGLICTVVAAPVMYVMGLLGTLIGYAFRSWKGKSGVLILSGMLPLVLGPLEQSRPAETVYRTVNNSILIKTSPAEVWTQIRSVPRIEDQEIHSGWVHLIGLPRPREAVLEGQGVGAYRLATFDGGLSFMETVTDWQENRLLSFHIGAHDPGQLDPHVRVGGRFFNVQTGTYRLEEVAPGQTMLHLSSTQRVSTNFNGYTAFLTQSIMHDLQRTILEVVRDRAEKSGLPLVLQGRAVK